MNRPFLFSLILAISCVPDAAASAAALVQFPTGDAAWTVAIQYNVSGGSAAPQRIDVTQCDNVRKIVITWSDGHSSEEWAIPRLPVYFKEDSSGSIIPVSVASTEAQENRAEVPADAPDLAWVSQATLQEKNPVDYEGKECFHYRKASLEAWIDINTLLPVAVNTGHSLLVFTFQKNPPAGPLVPSPKVATEIKYYKHVMGYPQ